MNGSPRSVQGFDDATQDPRFGALRGLRGFLERVGGHADLVSPWFHPIGSPIDHETIWECLPENLRNQIYREFVTQGVPGALPEDGAADGSEDQTVGQPETQH